MPDRKKPPPRRGTRKGGRSAAPKASAPADPTAPAGEAREPSPGPRSPHPIVGIGASAGGLEAFRQLLQHLPADTGAAFVLVQHLDPTHESILPALLARCTAMPVAERGTAHRSSPTTSTSSRPTWTWRSRTGA